LLKSVVYLARATLDRIEDRLVKSIGYDKWKKA
jgi:hypothetical protein